MKEGITVQIRWADIDANHHLRHSAYYDFGAMVRTRYFRDLKLGALFKSQNIGPILFREEAVFRREILHEDVITVDFKVQKARRDYSRWTVVHTFLKQDGILATTITVDMAWIDLATRKIGVPNLEIKNKMNTLPRTENFCWVDI